MGGKTDLHFKIGNVIVKLKYSLIVKFSFSKTLHSYIIFHNTLFKYKYIY